MRSKGMVSWLSPTFFPQILVSELNDVADGIRAAEISRGAITKGEEYPIF